MCIVRCDPLPLLLRCGESPSDLKRLEREVSIWGGFWGTLEDTAADLVEAKVRVDLVPIGLTKLVASFDSERLVAAETESKYIRRGLTVVLVILLSTLLRGGAGK